MEIKANFHCNECSENFASKFNLKRHIQSIHEKLFVICQKCGKPFKSKSNLIRHTIKCGVKESHYKCEVCDKSYATKINLQIHNVTHHKENNFLNVQSV